MSGIQMVGFGVARLALIFLPALGVLVDGPHTTAFYVRTGVFLVLAGGVMFRYYQGMIALDANRLEDAEDKLQAGDALASALGLVSGIASIWMVGSNGETWVYWWWIGAICLAFPILKRAWDTASFGLRGRQFLFRTVLAFGPLSYVAAINAALFLVNQQPLNAVSDDGLSTPPWTYACVAAVAGVMIAAIGMWVSRYSPRNRWYD